MAYDPDPVNYGYGAETFVEVPRPGRPHTPQNQLLVPDRIIREIESPDNRIRRQGTDDLADFIQQRTGESIRLARREANLLARDIARGILDKAEDIVHGWFHNLRKDLLQEPIRRVPSTAPRQTYYEPSRGPPMPPPPRQAPPAALPGPRERPEREETPEDFMRIANEHGSSEHKARYPNCFYCNEERTSMAGP